MVNPLAFRLIRTIASVPPTAPGSDEERHRALHAALVVERNVQKSNHLCGQGNVKRSNQIIQGTVGFLTSWRINLRHLSWARKELRRFPEGGHA